MKKEILFRHLMRAVQEKMERTDYGHQMSCLISAEFTPPVDYTSDVDWLELQLAEYNYSVQDFLDWIGECAKKWDAKQGVENNPYHYFGMDLGYFGCPVCGKPTRVHNGEGVCPDCEEKGIWVDPAGGVHYDQEEDLAAMYK